MIILSEICDITDILVSIFFFAEEFFLMVFLDSISREGYLTIKLKIMVINVKCIEAFIPCIHMLLNAVQKLRHSPKFS
ncbi:hypothetical protein EB796_007351 [Bugula neritina]|uniref:Uncharacterized protein n=1 Tax=Bugula neritina TaxID=10212 RepID=A0A7J7K9V4_BUGNE|nr:hypothetical protein EB796_007351 [Bugula neritina]